MEPRHVETQARDDRAAAARCPSTPRRWTFSALTGFPLTRGMLCAMRRRPLPAVEGGLRGRKARRRAGGRDEPHERWRDLPRAAALGIDAVLLTQACSDPLYRRAIRVSMARSFRCRGHTCRRSGRRRSAPSASRRRQWRCAMLRCPSTPRSSKRGGCLAVVLGTEGDGLAESTIAACDCTVRIPMTHGVDSLNVAAASAGGVLPARAARGTFEMED